MKTIDKLCASEKSMKSGNHMLLVYPEQRLYYYFDNCVCSVFPKRKECFISHCGWGGHSSTTRTLNSYSRFYKELGYTVLNEGGGDISKVEPYTSSFPISHLLSYYSTKTQNVSRSVDWHYLYEGMDKELVEIHKICATRLKLDPNRMEKRYHCSECPFGIVNTNEHTVICGLKMLHVIDSI